MKIKELKKILANAKDDSYVEVINKISKEIHHIPIQKIEYNKVWDAWQFEI